MVEGKRFIRLSASLLMGAGVVTGTLELGAKIANINNNPVPIDYSRKIWSPDGEHILFFQKYVDCKGQTCDNILLLNPDGTLKKLFSVDAGIGGVTIEGVNWSDNKTVSVETKWYSSQEDHGGAQQSLPSEQMDYKQSVDINNP